MATMWETSSNLSNIQGIYFVDDDMEVAPYLPAGDYHWRAIADDAGGAGNNITLHKFEATAEGFPTAAVNDNGAGWNELSGVNAFRSQLINDSDEVALDIADAGATYVNQGWLGTSGGGDVRDAAQAFTLSSGVELRKLKIYVNVKNGTGASGVTLGIYSGSTYGAGTLYASRAAQSLTTAASWFTSGELTAGDSLEGIALIHDAGQTYMDAGADQSFDFSSFTDAKNVSQVPVYQYASYTTDQGWSTADDAEANASWNGSWLTLTELQSETNTDNRYFYMKVKIIRSGGQYESLTGDVYSTDVTPPATPSGEYLGGGTYWTEPDDADYDHCELKRIIDGTTEYLNSVDGIATWQESEGTPFEFIDGDAAAGWQQSNYTDEDATGTSIAHYVRSVDAVGNASAWTLLDPAQITLPDTPTLNSVTPGDSQLVANYTAVNATDIIYAAYRTNSPGEAWEDESESFKRTGSGDITITGTTNSQSYEISGYVKNAHGVVSRWCAPVYAIPAASSTPVHDQVVDAVAALISAEGFTDYNSTAFTVSTTFPPRWDSKTAPTIFVMPDYTDPRPLPTKTIETAYAVTIAIYEHIENDAQLANRDAMIARIQQVLMQNLRPVTNVWLDGSDAFIEGRVFDVENLERFEFLTPLTVKYRGRTAR